MRLVVLLACALTAANAFSSRGASGRPVTIARTLSLRVSAGNDVVGKPSMPIVSVGGRDVKSSDWWNGAPLKRAGLAALLVGAVGFSQPSMASASIGSTIEAFRIQANDSGFLQAFLLIFISEIGDKTFFIAGLLAAKYGRFVSFVGSIGALAVMTVISTILGQIFHAIPESLTQGVPFDDIVAVGAFAYFGIKTLLDASKMEDGDNAGIEEEKKEAEEIVEELSQDEKRRSTIAKLVQTFTLVFAAEIGDRSFLSTIALSAALNPYAVATGAIAAHASATGVAVAGGVLLSKYLSEKVISYIGGSLFLVFAVTTALGIF